MVGCTRETKPAWEPEAQPRTRLVGGAYLCMELSAEQFEANAAHFVARTAAHSPSWAWVAPTPDGSPLPPPTGFLRSASITVPPLLSPHQDSLASEDALVDDRADRVDDDCASMRPSISHRLELHIVHSDTYRVPVLLLQGYGEDGDPWAPEAVRAHLGRCGSVGHDVVPLDMVSQMEHPVLRVPYCCIHPCRTADLMSVLAGDGVFGKSGKLDYLSAWWSVLAPAVGVRSASALFEAAGSPNDAPAADDAPAAAEGCTGASFGSR